MIESRRKIVSELHKIILINIIDNFILERKFGIDILLFSSIKFLIKLSKIAIEFFVTL